MSKDAVKEEEPQSILNEVFKGEVNFRFTAIPELSNVRAACPPIWTMGKGTMKYFEEYGKEYETVQPEHLKTCYFAPIMKEIDINNPSSVELPADLYCNEFLKLNPFNIEELLKFQRKYGQILGARANKHYDTIDMKEHLRPEPDGFAFSGYWSQVHKDQFEGIKASTEIYDSIPDDEFIDEFVSCKFGAVSFQECIATVLDTQRIINDTLRILRDDLPKLTNEGVMNAIDAVEWLSALLPSRMPMISLISSDYKVKTRTLGLIDVVHLQLARGLLNNNAYRTCQNPECQRLFTPVEMRRRLDTKYCCSECQERAKRLRYINKHSK